MKRALATTALAAALAALPAVRAQDAPAETAGPTLASIDRDLASVAADVDRLTDEGRRLEAEEQGLAPRRAALAQRAKGELRLLYHLSQARALAVRGGPEALLEHAARLERVRRAAVATLRDIAAAERRVTTVRVDRARARVLLEEANARRAALDARRREAAALSELRIPVSNAGLAYDPLAPGGVQANPGVVVSGEPPRAPVVGGAVTVYGGGVAATAQDTASFADAAGRLLFPVPGRTEVRRAQRAGAEGPGLEVLAPLGSPVRASFPGRVAFADRYGPYGRIVILDHGDHYYTVSANLGTVSVRVGDEVPTGAVLGTVGDDGRGPMLYFEVRRGSDTIDPAPWLGI